MKKLILCISSLIISFYGFSQTKILQLEADDGFGGHLATAFISKDAFLIRSSASLLKNKGSNKLIEYKELTLNKCLAIETKMADYTSIETLFTHKGQKEQGDTIIHADTIYYKTDTIINGFNCKKLAINYLRTTQYNIQTEKEPLAISIHTLVWVCPDIILNNPFSFSSKSISGFIIKYQDNRPPFPEVYGFTFKKVNQANISPWIFRLPSTYDLCSSRDEYEQRIADFIDINANK